MSPPEVWGPAVWILFHTLAEKINPNAYQYVFPSLFNIIVKICKYLPCPECSSDASFFLAKVKISELKTKESFKRFLCVFHNTVNAKKRKQIFNYSYIGIYQKYNLIKVVKNFISQYQTKGNMKLLTESFQRQFVIKDFKFWFQKYIKAFLTPCNVPKQPPQPISVTENPLEEPVVEETVVEGPVVEEPVTEEPVTEEPIAEETVVEEPVVEEPVTEEPVVEETVVEETVVEEPVVEEPVTEETVTEEPVTEEPVAEEPVVEEPVVEEPVTTIDEEVVEQLIFVVEDPNSDVEEPPEETI